MAEYTHGVLSQVRVAAFHENPSIEQVLDMRCESAGATPIFALIEYAYGLDLPDYVFECKTIKALERIGNEMVVMLVYPERNAYDEFQRLTDIWNGSSEQMI
ncbi:terpenoid synthase [Penicillium malachiteum]|uniref:Terpenoid synthase n=1 Tax=Penicillium malachiteum TaxID=1324776 RepID=A0AAD6HJ67_9EURO|nr:terpenoid synthase [Penicillium malachiteum]